MRRVLVGKMLRYVAGSLVATICSEVTFLVLYGPLGAASAIASTLGWLAGALPSYWLNRTWTWGHRGRPSFSREVVPYVTIVLVTLVLAVVMTTVADAALADVSDGTRTVLVGGVFLLVYVVMFFLRFFLFDRLFTRSTETGLATTIEPTAAKGQS